MKVFALIFAILLIAGCSFLIVWNLVKIIQAIQQKVRDKKMKQKEQHEKGKEK